MMSNINKATIQSQRNVSNCSGPLNSFPLAAFQHALHFPAVLSNRAVSWDEAIGANSHDSQKGNCWVKGFSTTCKHFMYKMWLQTIVCISGNIRFTLFSPDSVYIVCSPSDNQLWRTCLRQMLCICLVTNSRAADVKEQPVLHALAYKGPVPGELWRIDCKSRKCFHHENPT